MRRRTLALVLALSLASTLLVACGSNGPQPTDGKQAASAASTPAPSANTPTVKPAKATSAPKGDGTLKIKLNVLNPAQKQDRYSVFFVRTGSVNKGQALGNVAFVGPFTIDPAGDLVISIEKDLKTFLYQSSGITGPMHADLVVTRVEDTHIRNPLCTPVKLAFADLTTTDRGNALTVDVTDSALNDLYPEEVFIVKIVPPQIQGGGGYPRISYKKEGSSLMAGMERGSAGPDFLVAFPVAEIKSRGMREGTLVVMDENNKPKSEPVPLTFDENGRCKQGPLVMVKTTK